MNEEDRLAIPSFNESLVSDYIRNRIQPPKDLTGDKVIEIEVMQQPEDDYQKDLKKLKNLTPNELEILLEEIEAKSREGRGFFSKGPLLKGYAIDLITLKSIVSRDHDLADLELIEKINRELGDLENYIPYNLHNKRIIKGYVYLDVPNFKIPIVKLLGVEGFGDVVSKTDIEKITKHIKEERKFLPVSMDFQVL